MNNNGTFSLLIFALPLLLLGWLFYSQNKRMKQARDFSSALGVGDRVITSSGIFGTIKHLDDTSAWLEVAEGTTIRIDRRALAMKQSDTSGTPGTPGAGSVESGNTDEPGSTPGIQQNGQ